ncbi:Monopolin complex subunit pcs1 [Podospora conica]|nr:Monopolin complex subunit pcs1 [Schizothecium conicum]
MSKVKPARSTLLELIDSDSEDGLNGNAFAIAKPPAAKKPAKKAPKKPAATTTMPPKSGRGRPAANKVTKPAAKKAPARRNNERLAAAIDQALEEDDRSALEEKSANTQPKMGGRGRKKAAPAVEAEELDVDMEDVPEEVDEPAQKPKARGRPKKSIEPAPVKEASKPARAPPGRKGVRQAVQETMDVSEIPETQQPEPVVEEEEDRLEDLPPRQFSSPSKRPGYSSSSDSGGEPALRRKLGEMTQKFEALDRKYRALKEVAVTEAESNFDKLKKLTDEKTKAADQLITALKSEVAVQKEEAKEAARLKKQLDSSDTKLDEMQTRLTSLTTSLSESRTEIKALNMKLTAARSAEASALAKSSVPGSAMKGGGGMLNKAASAATTQQAQMKEDLYSDLTGLIVRGVKRDAHEDTYDCLQTGRNGTLHFKLVIPNDASADNNFEDAQFLYMPQLDPNRDRSLIDILPDYLVEEITFPRPHAAKFYARVMKALTEGPPA